MLDRIISPAIREKIAAGCEHLEVFFKYSMCRIDEQYKLKNINRLEGLGNFFLHPQLHIFNCSQGFWNMYRVELLHTPAGQIIKRYRVLPPNNIFYLESVSWSSCCTVSGRYLFGNKPKSFKELVIKIISIFCKLFGHIFFLIKTWPALLTVPIGLVLKTIALVAYQDVRLRHKDLLSHLRKERSKDEPFEKLARKITEEIEKSNKKEQELEQAAKAEKDFQKQKTMSNELSLIRANYIQDPNSVSLLDLPTEMLTSIIEYLEPQKINLVCKRLFLLAHEKYRKQRNINFETFPNPIKKLLLIKFNERKDIPFINLPAHRWPSKDEIASNETLLQPVGTNLLYRYVNFLKPRDMILNGEQKSVAMFKIPDGRLGIAFLYVIRSQKFKTLDQAPFASWRLSEKRTKLKVGTIHPLEDNKFWCVTTGKWKNGLLPQVADDTAYFSVLSLKIFDYMTALFSNQKVGNLFVNTDHDLNKPKKEIYDKADSDSSIELWKEEAIQEVC